MRFSVRLHSYQHWLFTAANLIRIKFTENWYKLNSAWIPTKVNCASNALKIVHKTFTIYPWRESQQIKMRSGWMLCTKQISLLFSQLPLLHKEGRNRISLSATSMCIYKFACFQGAEYTARATRCFAKRLKEHQPTRLEKGVTESIAGHLVAYNWCF